MRNQIGLLKAFRILLNYDCVCMYNPFLKVSTLALILYFELGASESKADDAGPSFFQPLEGFEGLP